MAPALLWPLLGHAVVLTWSAPTECPDVAWLQQQLPETLAGDATGSVEVLDSGYLLKLRINGAERTLHTATCDEAGRAAVFFIRGGLEKHEEVPAARVEAGPRWGFDIGAQATLGLAGLPQPAIRFGASLRAQRGPWGAVLDVGSSLSARYEGGPNAASSATVREPLDAQLGACRFFEVGRVELGPCVHGSVTWFMASGENVTAPKQTSVALWAAGPGLRAYLKAVDWLDVSAGAVARFGSRPSVFFDGSAPILQGSVFSLELSLAAGVRF
jgi:hypothetical protein